jgi:N-acylneuraminate cytidylyltransferase
MKVVGVVLARGGSKGIPRKNLREIQGESLTYRCAAKAVNSCLDKTYVYSDDNEILNEAAKAGAMPVERPEAVSGDFTTSEESVGQFIKDVNLDTGTDVMLLQCTTPFLKTVHIDKALRLYKKSEGLDSVLSATACPRYIGYKDKSGNWIPAFPYRWLRQEHESLYYMENGGFYLARQSCWKSGNRMGSKCGIVLMGWWESIEIDDLDDLVVARNLAEQFV